MAKTTTYADVGTNVTLNCELDANVEERVPRWRRKNGTLIVSGKEPACDKYHIMKNLNNTIFHLLIFNVNLTDSGTYVCDWTKDSHFYETTIELGKQYHTAYDEV